MLTNFDHYQHPQIDANAGINTIHVTSLSALWQYLLNHSLAAEIHVALLE